MQLPRITTLSAAALAATALLALGGCDVVGEGPDGGGPDFVPGDGDDDDDIGDDDDVPFVETTGLLGMVRDVDGNPLTGVRVSTDNGITAESGDNGTFSVVDLPVDQEGAVLVNFELPGYASTQVPFEILRDVHNTLLVTMALVDFEQSFDSAAGLDFAIEEGGPTVALPAGQYVDADGEPYVGEVHVSATSYDLFSDELYATPGDFTAIDIAGSPQILESYGMFTVDLTDAEGNEINLDPSGDGAPIVMPIQGTGPQVGEQISAWAYDESVGKWVEEATGTVVDLGDGVLAWEFTANHFSSWNCDQPIQTHGCVSGTVTDSNGNSRKGATVKAVGLTYTSTTTARTGNNGEFCLEVKNGETVRMEITYSVGGQVASQTTNPVTIPAGQASCSIQGSPCVDVGVIPVDIMSCLSGFVIDQQNQPVLGANVASPQGGQTTTDASGNFCLAVPVFQPTQAYVIQPADAGVGYQPVATFTQPARPDCLNGCANIVILQAYTNPSCSDGEVVINQNSAANALVDVYDDAFPEHPVFSTLTAQDGTFCAPVPPNSAVTVQVGSGDAFCDSTSLSTAGLAGQSCPAAGGQGGECIDAGVLACTVAQ